MDAERPMQSERMAGSALLRIRGDDDDPRDPTQHRRQAPQPFGADAVVVRDQYQRFGFFHVETLRGRRSSPRVIHIGPAGFEPATPCTPSKCATRLRYGPLRFNAPTFSEVLPTRREAL